VPKEKKRILAQLQAYREAKPGPFWASVGVAGMSLFGVVAAFGTAPTTVQIEDRRQLVVDRLPPPPPLPAGAESNFFVREERVQRGDTVASLLNRLGVVEREAVDFLYRSKDLDPIFRQLSPGKTLTARVGSQGELQSLIFPLNGGKNEALLIERGDQGYAVTEQSLPVDVQVHMKSAEIRYSLFGASDSADIPEGIAIQLADIFGGDIDFHRDLRKGDRFSVVYESISHLGKPIRSGRILAAEFTNSGKTYRAIWFQAEDGLGGYYAEDGSNIRKAFLRSPLEFSRITSGFSGARFHPVLKTWRAHKGVDYGAPVGTRVRATGDGIVEFVGTRGGYGKVIALRHQGRHTTLYGHLSGFATGVRTGVRVAQGDTIGFVGATGLASGPHLHYEFRINDVHQNPLAMALPSAPPLTPQQQAAFRDHSQEFLSRLDLLRTGTLALLN
jgi:murein DD-endopeptidase MepM/ murein hydrolase activator NlpD